LCINLLICDFLIQKIAANSKMKSKTYIFALKFLTDSGNLWTFKPFLFFQTFMMNLIFQKFKMTAFFSKDWLFIKVVFENPSISHAYFDLEFQILDYKNQNSTPNLKILSPKLFNFPHIILKNFSDVFWFVSSYFCSKCQNFFSNDLNFGKI
jgi:hypothetical protein